MTGGTRDTEQSIHIRSMATLLATESRKPRIPRSVATLLATERTSTDAHAFRANSTTGGIVTIPTIRRFHTCTGIGKDCHGIRKWRFSDSLTRKSATEYRSIDTRAFRGDSTCHGIARTTDPTSRDDITCHGITKTTNPAFPDGELATAIRKQATRMPGRTSTAGCQTRITSSEDGARW